MQRDRGSKAISADYKHKSNNLHHNFSNDVDVSSLEQRILLGEDAADGRKKIFNKVDV